MPDRGEVLSSIFMRTVPTAIVSADASFDPTEKGAQDNEEVREDIWAELEDVDDDSEDEVQSRRSKRA